MNRAKKLSKSLFACLLVVCFFVSLMPVAFAAEDDSTLHIADVAEVPESGSYETVYIDSTVGNNDVVLKDTEATNLIVQGGKSLTLDEGCAIENISMQHGSDAIEVVVADGVEVNNLVVESAKAPVTVSGRVANLEVKSDNAEVTVESGSIDNSNVSGKNAKLTIGEKAVSATLTVLESATESQIVVKGSVVTATAAADSTKLTVEKSGSVAVLSTGESTKGAAFEIGGIVGHVIVTENSAEVKIDITDGGNVTAIGAAASVEINVDDNATLSHLVSAVDAVISGNAKADDVQVKDEVVSNGVVNFAGGNTAGAVEEETEQPVVEETVEAVVPEVIPEGTVAAIGKTYYTDLQDALNAEGNVTLYAGQIFGIYQVLGPKLLSIDELTENEDADYKINMWELGQKGTFDADGNPCPEYVSITDTTLYSAGPDDTNPASAAAATAFVKYYYEGYYWPSVFIDANSDEVAPTEVYNDQVIVPYSKAINMNGNSITMTSMNGNGLRLGQDTYDDPTNEQTFYVSNGKFIAKSMEYDYDNLADKTSYDPTAWEETGERCGANTLNMRDNSTYIIDKSEFTDGYVQLNMGEDNDNNLVSAAYFDDCTFTNTDINIVGGSYDNQTDGYKVNVNFNGCSFVIGSDGTIKLNYYVWGNVNFSNCEFTVDNGVKPISSDASLGSNGNNELVITLENCTINGEAITADNINEVLTAKAATTVFVDSDGIYEGEDTVKAISSTVTTEDTAPESAELNTLLAEQAAEDVLDVEILTNEDSERLAELQAAAESVPTAASEMSDEASSAETSTTQPAAESVVVVESAPVVEDVPADVTEVA